MTMSSRRVFVVFAVLLAAAGALANPNEFVAVKPGGATICSQGGEYAFFFRKGTVNKLAIYIEGGGACWDGNTCDLPIYTRTVDVSSKLNDLNSASGILNQDDCSPVKEYNALYVPYCTGDVHAGNQTTNYGWYSIHHRGRVNMEAALSYAKLHVPSPSRVANIGCSAGSLGVFINAPYIMEHFPDAVHSVWGDSEVGILSESQYAGALKNWDLQLAVGIVPALEYYLDIAHYSSFVVGEIVATQANFFSKYTWSAYTSDFDLVQSSYYKLGNGTGDWGTLMRDELKFLHQNTTNMYTYIAAGGAHCQSDNKGFYSTTTAGVALYQWVSDIINGATTNHAVDCYPNCL